MLEVADVIRSRLGEPAVTALACCFAPGGTYLTCGDRFGAGPLSVCACRVDDGIVTPHQAFPSAPGCDPVARAGCPRGGAGAVP